MLQKITNENGHPKKFRDLGIEQRYILIDKQSGKNLTGPQYQAMLLIICEGGDLLLLDSLAEDRDFAGIIREWKYITRDPNADIVVLENETLLIGRNPEGG
ncbi:hypothetical protein [Peribacillus phoenicis]|uniref:hypothetical protein n=1 Tax=Peribacillus sp. 1P06PA-2 TaxID=3132295 RepID=UPI0039A7742E